MTHNDKKGPRDQFPGAMDWPFDECSREGKFGKEVTSVEHRAGWDATFSAQARIGIVHAPETTGKFVAATFEHDTARPVTLARSSSCLRFVSDLAAMPARLGAGVAC